MRRSRWPAAACLLLAAVLPGIRAAAVPGEPPSTTATALLDDDLLNEIPGIAATSSDKAPNSHTATHTLETSTTREAPHQISTTKEHTATATIKKKDLPTSSWTAKTSVHASTTPSPGQSGSTLGVEVTATISTVAPSRPTQHATVTTKRMSTVSSDRASTATAAPSSKVTTQGTPHTVPRVTTAPMRQPVPVTQPAPSTEVSTEAHQNKPSTTETPNEATGTRPSVGGFDGSVTTITTPSSGPSMTPLIPKVHDKQPVTELMRTSESQDKQPVTEPMRRTSKAEDKQPVTTLMGTSEAQDKQPVAKLMRNSEAPEKQTVTKVMDISEAQDKQPVTELMRTSEAHDKQPVTTESSRETPKSPSNPTVKDNQPVTESKTEPSRSSSYPQVQDKTTVIVTRTEESISPSSATATKDKQTVTVTEPRTEPSIPVLATEVQNKQTGTETKTESATPSPTVKIQDKQVATELRTEPSNAMQDVKLIVRTELGSTTITMDPRTEGDSSEHGGEVGGERYSPEEDEDGAGLHGDVLEDGDEILMADQPANIVEVSHFPGDLDAKLSSLDCAVPQLPPQSILWRTNQTHELELPLTVPVDCRGSDCPPPALGWEANASMQSGDVLLVRIDNTILLDELDRLRLRGLVTTSAAALAGQVHHQPQEAVYGVTREEMEDCDVSQGLLLDITPLLVDGKLLLALYDKDLSDGDNFLVILSERWAQGRCIKLHVLMKSDNCGENQDCSGKGVCFSKDTMEGFECQCCPGFLGPHCEEKDACLPSPCLNQGICLDVSQGHEDNQFSCLCPYGFTGDRCEVVTDPCDSEPCQNGGTCHRNGTEWACTCLPEYRGQQCEHALNPCVPSPCKYGVCVNKDGVPSCYCQPGFAGKRCELQFRMCGSMPCLNDGECLDVVDGFSCRCGRGFRGERCEIKVTLCHTRSCKPGQICRDLGNNVTCECPAGTVGQDCRPTPAPPRPCSSSPCRHGGTCYNSDRGFYCACRPGFTGTTCNEEAILEEIPAGAVEMAAITRGEEAALAVPLHLHSVYVGAATLACALLIVVATVAACHCRVYETYKRCLVIPCGLRDPDPRLPDPAASLSSKGSRGQPLLDSLKEPLSALPITSPLLDSDMYYALDFSDSQSSPLIQ